MGAGRALTIRWALLDPYAVPSGSMLPSLLIGDRMFVDKTAYGVRVPFTSTWLARWGAPHRGDVVIFADPEHPRRMLVKRVAAVAGDHLRWENDGLVLNGVPLAQQALPEADPWRADLPVELGEAAIAYAAVAAGSAIPARSAGHASGTSSDKA